MARMNPGTYHGKLVSASMVEVGEKKTPAVEFAIEVTMIWDGEAWRDGNNGPQLRTITKYLSPAAEKWTLHDLGKFEFNGNFADMRFRPDMYTDGVQLVMYIESNKGKEYEKWNFAECASKKSQNPEAAQSLVDTFNAKWKQKEQSAPTTTPTQAPATPTPNAAPTEEPIPEDDIPF